MFHLSTRPLAGLVLLFSLTAHPLAAQAEDPVTQVPQGHSVVSNASESHAISALKSLDIGALEDETRAALFDAKHWVKDHQATKAASAMMVDLEDATDRLQLEAAPIGRSLKKSVKHKLPSFGIVHRLDRTVTVYGLMLMMAFAFLCFLFSLSGPKSRLSGRH